MSDTRCVQALSDITNENINEDVHIKIALISGITEVVTKQTIDNITYTIRSRSCETATQSLHNKLDASIARDIAREIAQIT